MSQVDGASPDEQAKRIQAGAVLAGGGEQHSPVTDEQIEAALQAIADRRRKHKYQPADLITREFLQRIACESK